MSDDPTKKLPLTTDEMLGEILNRLETLERSVDQRLKQTTPLSVQMAELLERMETGFREAGDRQDRLETEFRKYGERQDRLETEIRNLGERLDRLETEMREFGQRQDRLETEMREFGQRQDRLETEIREFGKRQDRTEKELREINRTLRKMNVDLATALRDQDELGDRITAIETQMSQT